MKRKLKEFATWFITIVLFFIGSVYYLNFEVDGDIGFVAVEEATVFQAPRLNSEKIDTLYLGEDVTILKPGISNSKPFVKVRLGYPDKSLEIGYISEKKIGHYEFPNIDLVDSNYLIFCDENVSLDKFIPEFKKEIAENSIIGVYFKREAFEPKNRSELEHFLSTQHIPWGIVSDLDENSIESFEEAFAMENSLSSMEIFEDYNLLPVVFNMGYSDSSPLLDNIDFPYIILSSNLNMNKKGVPIWIDSNANSLELETDIEKESIYAYTFEKKSSFSLVLTSNSWTHEIRDAYETAREEAAE